MNIFQNLMHENAIKIHRRVIFERFSKNVWCYLPQKVVFFGFWVVFLVGYLAIICTFHYLQISEQKTELFAKNANNFFLKNAQYFDVEFNFFSRFCPNFNLTTARFLKRSNIISHLFPS